MKKYPEKFKHLFEYGREGLIRTEELNALANNKKNDGKLFASCGSGKKYKKCCLDN